MAHEDSVTFTVYDQTDRTMYSLALRKPKREDIESTDKIHENDRYSKHKVTVRMSGDMIVTQEANQSDATRVRSKKALRSESYEEYIKRRSEIPIKNVQWAFNIVDGVAEQDRILFRSENFVIIPTFGWDGKNFNKLHLLALFTNKDLMSLRDLRGKHIPILRDALDEGYRIIKEMCGLDGDRVKAYIHYPPSTWLLHIHFNPIDYTTVSSSAEYAHLVQNVIQNLQIVDDYYERVSLLTSD